MPIDTAKVRLQTQGQVITAPAGLAVAGTPGVGAAPRYRNMFDCVSQIARHEGVGGLFKGLAPALIRQVSYSGLTFVLYEPIRNAICGSDGLHDATYFQRLLSGGTAGAL